MVVVDGETAMLKVANKRGPGDEQKKRRHMTAFVAFVRKEYKVKVKKIVLMICILPSEGEIERLCNVQLQVKRETLMSALLHSFKTIASPTTTCPNPPTAQLT